MIFVVVLAAVLLAIGLICGVLLFEWQRRREAARLGRVPTVLPWSIVAKEAAAWALELVTQRRFGMPTVDGIIAAARAETGLTELRDETLIRRELALWIATLDNPAMLFMARKQLADSLVGDVVAQLHLCARQSCARVALPRPMWIVGLPRSGTTMLFHMLSLDPRAHALPLMWQMARPLPPPAANFADDPRAQMLRKYWASGPPMRIAEVHQMGADLPEEDQFLLSKSFAKVHVDTGWFDDSDGAVLADWRAKRDDAQFMRSAFRDHRALVEGICENRAFDDGDHLLLKSTTNGAWLEQLVEQYPDAVFVQTHRDPLASVVSFSWLSLLAFDHQFRHIDAARMGRFVCDFHGWHIQRLAAYRRSLPPQEERRRFVDVQFEDVLRDPIAVVERVYAHFGMAVSDEHRRAMLTYISENPAKSSSGSFDKRQFAVTQAMIDKAFGRTNK